MTEYERGFSKKCMEHGLTERQAGALCKLAYFWDTTPGPRNSATYRGVNDADAEFMANMGIDPNSAEGRKYMQQMNRYDGGKHQDALTRWWRRNFHSRDWQENQARQERMQMQQRYLDDMEANKINIDAQKLQMNRIRGIKNPGNEAPAAANIPGAAPGTSPNPPTASSPIPGNTAPTATGFQWKNGRPVWT